MSHYPEVFTFSGERCFLMDSTGGWVLRMSFWSLPERPRQEMSVVKCHLHLCCLQKKKHKSDRKNTKKTKKHTKKTGNAILISAAHKKIQKHTQNRQEISIEKCHFLLCCSQKNTNRLERIHQKDRKCVELLPNDPNIKKDH